MSTQTGYWDYLIVTASNPKQAAAYESQLKLPRELGLFHGIAEVLVAADPGASASEAEAALSSVC